MIKKEISIGAILTFLMILGTFIYTQGESNQRIEALENDTKIAMTRVSNAENQQNEINVKIGKIETKMDEGFKNLEFLILHEL